MNIITIFKDAINFCFVHVANYDYYSVPVTVEITECEFADVVRAMPVVRRDLIVKDKYTNKELEHLCYAEEGAYNMQLLIQSRIKAIERLLQSSAVCINEDAVNLSLDKLCHM